MKKVTIAGYLRTPISRARPNKPEADAFNSLRMDECAASLIREILKQKGVPPEAVNRCIIGCANQQGEQWLYGGRVVSLLADLPYSTPAVAVDVQCGSSMSAIQMGAMEIAMGYSDVVMAGGMEHMTHVPMRSGTKPNPNLLHKNRFDPAKINKTISDMYDAQGDRYLMPSMGDTAELLASEAGITREEMDRWAERSHKLATKALKEEFFKGEIMDLEVTDAEGVTRTISHDLSIRPDTTYEQIASLKPAFNKDGIVTAGNSSPLNSAASMIMLMSEEKAKEYGLKPLAEIVSLGWGGVDPVLMGKGPLPASQMALARAGLTASDIDYWEINEAFAVVTLWNMAQMQLDPDRVNIKGGAIALGHALGMTGARLVGTLARILELEGGEYGLATACIGGGQGLATLIKSC
ncbi:MAG: acetyl-CoA C-acetyltransferase [Firmicutes bacterium]|nr:acetyl-CoA C-acetyltransferase [Bacillota bacterium]